MKKTISTIIITCSIILINLTNVFATNPAETFYPADIEEGYIGISKTKPTDSPTDNVFMVLLKEQPEISDEIWLSYELYGISDHTGISRSVNDQLAVGGQLVEQANEWNLQKEQLNPTWLKQGENVVRFTLPENAQYHYQIKNLGIKIKKAGNSNRAIIINQPASKKSANNWAYLKGFVKGKDSEQATLYANNIPLRMLASEFETLKHNNSNSENWTVSLKAVFTDGEVIEENVNFTNSGAANFINEMPLAAAAYSSNEYIPSEAFVTGLSHAEISIEPDALPNPTQISITALRKVDIPPMDMGMINVTQNSEAYRFLPHGTNFSKVAKVKLGYDETKIPDGYSAKDIRTYFFDENTKHWVALPLDTVLSNQNTIISKTTHFTDMINGIIKAPESPETGAFTPTSIKDIKAADPSANINTIEPPSANNMGNANLGYPIVLPAGRQGMQPQLGIQYNSGGGNGWLGLGWNLSIPAVTIETRWGVPRYDPELETETYTLNGAQLAPVAHRNKFQQRTADTTKRFHPRVEGNFDRIIRHGTSPTNYWWEVTDKSGTVNSYGGLKGQGVLDASVLKDDDGNIAHWALVETRDLNDNFVRYHCTNKTTNGGREIYVERITYTGHGLDEGKYEVLFTRDSEENEGVVERKDITVNCMLGFKRVTADLLQKIDVNFNSEPVRSYELTYREGAFYKTLLDKITEFDAAGNQFTQHSFDYYDDVKSEDGYVPFKEETTWTTEDDKVEGPITLDFIFEDDASAIGANKSSGKGFSTTITAGAFDGNLASKSKTAGGSIGFDFSKNEGLLALVDINGDGLPDKVFKTDTGLVFRANESGPDGPEQFADPPTKIIGVGDFSKGKSKTRNLGLESNFFVFLGYQNSKTTSTTSTYFADVNGDQLIDIVHNCVVHFNSIVDGVPTFTKSSADTPSPISANAGIDGDIITIDEAEIKKEEQQSPLHDVVRTWIAPYNGTVSIAGDVVLGMPKEASGSADGVRVTIEHKGVELWSKTIGPEDFNAHSPFAKENLNIPDKGTVVLGERIEVEARELNLTSLFDVDDLMVNKGDRIFFRVQSIYDGTDDQVFWSPTITYEQHMEDKIDANGLPTHQFNASDDFLLTGVIPMGIPFDGKMNIESTFNKPLTSDAIMVSIIKRNGDNVESLFSQTYAADRVIEASISPKNIAVSKGEQLEFRMMASTSVDWTAIEWSPTAYYVESDDDEINIVDDKGEPITTFYPVVAHTIFNNPLKPTRKWIAEQDGILSVMPQLVLNSIFIPGEEGTITFTVKKVNELLHTQNLNIVNGLPASDFNAVNIAVESGDELYFEYHVLNEAIANAINYMMSNVMLMQGMSFSAAHTALHTTSTDNAFLGSGYRYWGQFAYNGNDMVAATTPIDEDSLDLFIASAMESMGQTPPEINFDSFEGSLDQNSSFEDSEAVSDEMNKMFEESGGSNMADAQFIMFFPIPEEGHYRGCDNLTYVNQDTISASRLGEDNLLPVLPIGEIEDDMEGTGAIAIKKISKTYNNSLSISGSFPGPVSPGGNLSFGRSVQEYEYMDMNGDRHPDVVAIDKIQYTLPTGGLEDELTNVGFDEFQKGKSFAWGISASGSFLKATLKSSNSRGNGSSNEEGAAKISVGLSGSVNFNNDNTNYALRDINADGLPDKVYQEGEVQLNLGYKFAAKESWNFNSANDSFDEINKGSSTSLSGGLSFSIDNLSVSGGLSLSNSKNLVENTLQDVNGDGLPDYIESVDPVKVRINTGYAFADAIEWTGAVDVNRSNNVGESANGSYTFGIPLVPPFPVAKLCVNISANGSRGISEEKVQISDLNGDGYPDYLTSEVDQELTVRYSTIGRTNMLREVKRPLGAVITMDYGRVGNTYAHPSNVWALNSSKIYDGFTGDGADTLLNTFVYEDGYYDRHERDFYGFQTVKTNHHDTESERELYRTTVENFLNTNFYENGLTHRKALQDSEGNLYTEDFSNYQLKDVKTGNALDSLDRKTDDGCAFPAMVLMEKKFYEGQPEAGKETSMEYDYDEVGNVKGYIDFGEPGDVDDISSAITYYEVLDKYIMNAPESIIVSGKDSTIYRKREADIDTNNGNVTEMRMFLENDESANYSMLYDKYGNIQQLKRPWNYKGERLTYDYIYDAEVQTYNIGVNDSYGYSSSATYDYRFGQMLTNTDLNNNPMRYEIDDAGRITTITGPFELAEGLPYTIAFEYYPSDDSVMLCSDSSVVSYATTKHYDPQHPENDIETYTFMDGLKRPLQVKKDGALFSAPWQKDDEKMIISGRVAFDAFGRTTESYYPTLEEQGTQTVFNCKKDSITPTRTEYDVLDRQTAVYLPDTALTAYQYDFGADRNNNTQFRTRITDANDIWKESFTNVRELKVSTYEQHSQGENIWTSFAYNPINELTEVLDDHENIINYQYDWLGRKTSRVHPDAGKTSFKYDLASNLRKEITAKLREQDEAISYQYDFERLTNIKYPFNTYNDVTYTYGEAGAEANRAGRIIRQQDATGEQRFWYDELGAIVKNERTIHLPDCVSLEFTTKWIYDTWNRVLKMEYPDKEVVTYAYNVGGKLNSMNGLKKKTDYYYVKQLGYDKFEQRVYLHYGNGTETHYTYEEDRRRLETMTVENTAHRKFIDYEYDYDEVTNITRFRNHAGVEKESHLLGGTTDYNYEYDDMYRLTSATGYHKGSKGEDQYSLAMAYNNVHSITAKNQLHERKINTADVFIKRKKTSYDFTYEYDKEKQPHAPIKVGDKSYTYDVNGNQSGWDEEDDFRRILWDEEDRLAAINENGAVFKYLYDADGERIIKNTGQSQAISINGESHPLYDSETWAQHWNNGLAWLEHWHDNHHTDNHHNHDDHEQHDHGVGHDHLPNDCVSNSTIYVNPFVVIRNRTVTKHFYIEDQRVVTKMADPYDELFQDNRGPLDDLHDEEHGFEPHVETDLYFYHPDHLGNTGFVTQSFGDVSQHVEYFAFGETFLEEHNNTTHRTPYLFNAKELDEETGLYYYGARYYDPIVSNWLSVDPMADHPNQVNKSPYAYAWNNPVILNDPDGKCPNCVSGGVGALVGGAVGGASKALGSWWRGEKVSLKEIGKAAISGAVAGAVIGSGAGLVAAAGGIGTAGGVAATVGVGAAAGVAGETTSQGLDMADGMRAAGDFDVKAIAANGAIAGPLNVAAAGTGQALKGKISKSVGRLLGSPKQSIRAAQKAAGNQVKSAGGTKAQFKAARKAAKQDAKANFQQRLNTVIQSATQAISGVINGSGRSAANSKMKNNE